VTVQSATVIAGGCTVSGTTVTVRAASSNSSTWAALLFGNPN
jgi:3-deoxy-D-arabino-heptulosonate 7-phosphate (DAHP) synthase